MKKITVIIVSFLLLQMSCLTSYAKDFVLVCHKDSPMDTLTSQQLKRIFLGKMKKWPDGPSIDIVVNSNKQVHGQFTRTMLQKTPSQLSNYWKKILFSGRSMLPAFVKNDVDAKRYVIEHSNALTYIAASSFDNTLKKITIVE